VAEARRPGSERATSCFDPWQRGHAARAAACPFSRAARASRARPAARASSARSAADLVRARAASVASPCSRQRASDARSITAEGTRISSRGAGRVARDQHCPRAPAPGKRQQLESRAARCRAAASRPSRRFVVEHELLEALAALERQHPGPETLFEPESPRAERHPVSSRPAVETLRVRKRDVALRGSPSRLRPRCWRIEHHRLDAPIGVVSCGRRDGGEPPRRWRPGSRAARARRRERLRRVLDDAAHERHRATKPATASRSAPPARRHARSRSGSGWSRSSIAAEPWTAREDAERRLVQLLSRATDASCRSRISAKPAALKAR